MSFTRRAIGSSTLILLFVSSGLAGAAMAKPAESPVPCSRYEQSLTKGDGSILIAASAGNANLCSGSTNPEAVDHIYLAQLKADGSSDRNFADHGILNLAADQGGFVELLAAGSGEAVLVTDTGLTKLLPDGSFDPSFGQAGRVPFTGTDTFGNRQITAAAVQEDGKIVVAARDPRLILSPLGPVVARFEPDGAPDPAFGGDGVVNPPVVGDPAFFRMKDSALDGQNRIGIAADLGVANPIATIRLLPDSTPDPNYGTDNNGVARTTTSADSPPSFDGPLTLFADADGSVRLYGVYQCLTYCTGNILWELDPDGIQLPTSPRVIDQYSPGKFANGSGVFVETPDGGLVSTSAPGRFQETSFNVFKQFLDGPGGFEKVFTPSPFVGVVRSISYADGFLLAGGSAPDNPDRVGKYMAVVRLDAATGEPDPGFGTGGTAIVPPNECPYGDASPRAGEPPQAWKRCRVKRPKIAGKARLGHVNTRRPSLSGVVKLVNPPEAPRFVRQRVKLRLPKRLRPTRRAASKIKVNATVKSTDPTTRPDEVKVRVKRKTISIAYVPKAFTTGIFNTGPPNGSLRVRFKVRRGAFSPAGFVTNR
ncbi:MAG: hypothetical protein IPK93_03540 [Solirubrobacterales bacterium]|nr:hypothetical protein [Solirubrobacterales bacterium]